jgi:endogenous inhibitor of DNA gyrase (YacG/DUF329 family)
MASSADPRLCVFCRRHPVDPAWRPFCSERCKIQDLARWADGRYRVPADESQESRDDSQESKVEPQPKQKRDVTN